MGRACAAIQKHGVKPRARCAKDIGAIVIAASVYLCYAFADRLALVLGETGMSIIMRCWAGSVLACGVIFCIQNWLATMTTGRMRIGICSGWDKSVTHSQLAPRISTETVNTL